MKTITGNVVSSKPISLSKAASTLSSFLSVDNGASKALCAYLRRASTSFNELKQLHKDLKSSRSDRNPRHHGFEVSSGLEAAVDSSHRIENGERIKSSVSESRSGKKRRESRDRNENEQDGKTAMASGGNGDFEDVVGEDGKRRSDELRTEIEEKPSRRVEVDVKSSDRDESVVGIEKKKKHKKKSKDGEDERDAEVGQSYGKSQTSANNGETEASEDFIENNVGRGKDRKKHKDKNNLGDEKRTKKDNDDEIGLVELSTKDKKKKKKKKKNREEDDDDLQNNSGGAIEKEKMPVSDTQELKRKESKKRKNGDLEEGVDDGSEEQQGTKRRKRKS